MPTASFIRVFLKLFKDDDLGHHAAAAAYYALFAAAPFIIVLITLSRRLLGGELTNIYLIQYLQERYGEEMLRVTERFIESFNVHGLNAYFAAIGILIFLYAVIKFFEEARKIFFRIFKLRIHEKNLLRRTLRQRIMAGIYMIASLSLIVIFMTANIILTTAGEVIAGFSQTFVPAFHVIQFCSVFILTVLIFAALYHVASFGAVSWRSAFYGGIVAGLGLLIANSLFALYLTFSASLPVYGAAGFLIALMLWLYYGALVIFSGAEVAKIADS